MSACRTCSSAGYLTSSRATCAQVVRDVDVRMVCGGVHGTPPACVCPKLCESEATSPVRLLSAGAL
eukprot:2783571-Prymnesium_polylepis.1